MISPKQALAVAPYVGAAIVLYLIYLDVLTTGWSVGAVLILAMAAGGVFMCFLSRPWCKIGTVLVGVAFAIMLAVALDIPIAAGGLALLVFWVAK